MQMLTFFIGTPSMKLYIIRKPIHTLKRKHVRLYLPIIHICTHRSVVLYILDTVLTVVRQILHVVRQRLHRLYARVALVFIHMADPLPLI